MMLALFLRGPSANAEQPSCAAELLIVGAQALELRARIAGRGALSTASAACGRATASLESSAVGWRVALELDGRRVEREVEDLDDAVLALESWLTPRSEPSELPIGPKPSASLAAPGAPTPAPGSSASVAPRSSVGERRPVLAEGALSASAALGSDGSVWAGGELGGALVLRRSLWFGATLGALWDPVFADESITGDGVHRRLLRASVRGGARFQFGAQAVLDLGLGAGLGSSRLVRDGNGPRLSDDAGPAFVEVLAVVNCRVTPNVRWLAALSGSKILSLQGDEPGTDPDDLLDRGLPPTHPSLLFGLSIGLAYSRELD